MRLAYSNRNAPVNSRAPKVSCFGTNWTVPKSAEDFHLIVLFAKLGKPINSSSTKHMILIISRMSDQKTKCSKNFE